MECKHDWKYYTESFLCMKCKGPVHVWCTKCSGCGGCLGAPELPEQRGAKEVEERQAVEYEAKEKDKREKAEKDREDAKRILLDQHKCVRCKGGLEFVVKHKQTLKTVYLLKCGNCSIAWRYCLRNTPFDPDYLPKPSSKGWICYHFSHKAGMAPSLSGKKAFQCPQADTHDDTLTERKKDVCVKCGGPLTTKSSIRSNKGCPETLCVYECGTCKIKWSSAVTGCRSGKHLPKPRTEQWTCFYRGHHKEVYLSCRTGYQCRESHCHGCVPDLYDWSEPHLVDS